MKIAIMNTWAISNKAIGGTERFVMDLAKSFVQNKHEVDVFMFSGKNYTENNVNYININLFDMDGEADEYVVQHYFGSFENDEAYKNLAKKLENKIEVNKYDFIQLNSLLFLEAWKDKKRIFTIHTNPFEYELAWGKKSYNKMLELMSKYKNDENTIFVAPSKFYANEYSKLTNCHIKFIPHTIDIQRIQTEKSKNDILDQYDLAKEKIRIIVPSRLEPIQKQPMLLLNACCLLNDEGKNKIQIIFTGLDKQYEKFVKQLRDQAENNKIDIKIIRFDYMSEAYKIADITVLPSKSESFGYSALESLSLGIYTILNDIPTFNEIVQGNDYHYIFKNDMIGLKDKLQEVIGNSTYLKRKLPNKDWQKRYDLNDFEKAYMDLIKKKAIIFDLDGTLWDTTTEVKTIWEEVASTYKIEIKDKQIKDIMGLTKDEIIQYLFGDNIPLGEKFIEECQNKENEYLSQYGGGIYENTIKAIKKLSQKYDLFIVSNCQVGYIEAFLKYYQLQCYFKDYESSGNTGKDKEFNIKTILERNNIENAIYVGDTKKDYLASKNNNIKFIFAKYGFGVCEFYDDCINDIMDLV